MGGAGELIRFSGQRKCKVQAPQMMYYLEGGLLMVSNLLLTDSWVNDELRTHCSACFMQFLPFRRRHHCRTCGEVVCGGCSSQRAIRLTDMNVECETRVCTFCIIRAADASIKANEAAMKETSQEHRRLSTVSVLSLASPAVRRRKQMTLLSADSELTLGSVVQLWPQPVPANETARLEVARNSTIRSAEVDPTMNLLVSIVGRALECPAALIGIMDDSLLWVKASVGLDDRVTHIPRDDCVCAHTLMQDKTMIVGDTCADKHFFHAGGHAVGGSPMRYYAGTPVRVRGHGIGVVCAFDTEPHSRTTDAMTSTLEAVANIVSEVLEQRVAADGTMDSPVKVKDNADLYQRHRTNTEELDLHASLLGLNLLLLSQRTVCSSEDHDHGAPRASLYLPYEYSDKITMNMDYFQQLQRSSWVEHAIEPDMSNNGTIKQFELFSNEKLFTRSVTKMAGDCSNVVTQLLDYEDALLYQQFFSQVSGRRELSGQTWVDNIILRPSLGATNAEGLQVVTHRRKYPDGSNVIVAISTLKEVSESDLLFGWFVAPSGCEDEANSVNVSCIAIQSSKSQSRREVNLSLDLLRRLNQKLAMTRFFHLPSEMPPSIKAAALRAQLSGNQSTHEGEGTISSSKDNQGEKQDMNEREANPQGDNTNYVLPESNRAALVAPHESEQGSQLNQNEQLLLELLDKTISTQEILAERQHEMADLITTHGDQLERISSALSRVESILLDKEAKRNKAAVK
ncbi:GAF domain-containing protein [Phytophthora infestans]|uniref:GAF domain-containing protein n=1 Tax=Phytophthora infestans TaxID=4787 RepID=A0A8S9UJR8_PHYIN|nr:GAF domain-containing protein [Phytophthora infestans]